MKKIVALIVFNLTIWSLAFAQSPIAELSKVNEIKLLESTRDDVVKLLAGDSLDYSEYSHYQHFYMLNANIRILYSSGKCFSDSEEESEDWNVPEWKVVAVTVTPKNSIRIEDTGIDFANFRKEKIWGSLNHRYAYHDKSVGIAIIVRNEIVESIEFFPSKENYSRLCNKAKVKKYYSSKNWNRNPEFKKAIIDPNHPANVVNLNLSQTEIIADCSSLDETRNKSCSDGGKKISISIDVIDAEADVFTSFYKISAGKIIGQGANVVWDLSGVKPGTYTITAAADDGCGLCGKWITKTIVVKECPDCAKDK